MSIRRFEEAIVLSVDEIILRSYFITRQRWPNKKEGHIVITNKRLIFLTSAGIGVFTKDSLIQSVNINFVASYDIFVSEKIFSKMFWIRIKTQFDTIIDIDSEKKTFAFFKFQPGPDILKFATEIHGVVLDVQNKSYKKSVSNNIPPQRQSNLPPPNIKYNPPLSSKPPPPYSICPICNKNTTFNPEYKRYWCNSCNKYL